MKIKLTPEVSYLVGLWKHCRTREGIGIVGSEDMRTTFLSRAMALGVADASKVKWEAGSVYFFHSAYRTFFDEVLKEEVERFCHANDYAAAFLAGLFDGNGGVEEGKAYVSKWDKNDEMVLMRLNFKTLKADRRLWVGPADVFLKFIKNWRGVERAAVRNRETTRDEWMKKRAARAPAHLGAPKAGGPSIAARVAHALEKEKTEVKKEKEEGKMEKKDKSKD